MNVRGVSPLLAVVLVAVMCSLVPLAHATPPDETWRPGIYDDADLDDVVLVVTGQVSLAALTVWALLFVLMLVEGLHRQGAVARPASTACFGSSRAPPASRLFTWPTHPPGIPSRALVRAVRAG